MLAVKKYQKDNVLEASRRRIAIVFDKFERIYVAFSGGKDSTVALHLVMEEAIKRNRKVGVLYIDFEAQYKDTIDHIENMVALYRDYIDMHWVCVPMRLRNALTNYEPQWICWDEDKRELWVREKPLNCKGIKDYPWLLPKLEFEEFVPLWGEWYSQGKASAGIIAIRADESLHRYCAIATWDKVGLMVDNYRWTTKVTAHSYNIYPIYDWKTEDIWRYHAKYPDKPHKKFMIKCKWLESI